MAREQRIQLYRRLTGTGHPQGPVGATGLYAGEPFFNRTDDALWIGDSDATDNAHLMIGAARQLELAGNQTVANSALKTFTLATGVQNLSILGGLTGDVLRTDGAGGLTWAAPGASGIPNFSTTANYGVGDFVFHGGHLFRAHTAVTAGSAFDGDDWDQIATVADLGAYLPLAGGTLSGNIGFSNANAQILGANGLILNTTAGPISLAPLAANAAVNITTTGTGSIHLTSAATGNIHLDAAQVLLQAAPTVDLGAATKKYVDDHVGALASAVVLIGQYDADTDHVTLVTGSPMTTAGPLPPAAGHVGWAVIVTVAAAAGSGNAAGLTNLAVGDWLISTGSAWIHVPISHPATIASQVGVSELNTTTPTGWANVQTALQGIYNMATAAAEVHSDGVTIDGDGTTATPATGVGPLRVIGVDGGTY